MTFSLNGGNGTIKDIRNDRANIYKSLYLLFDS